MYKTLSFNGEKKPWLHLLQGRSKPPFASVTRNILKVSGMPGAHLQSTDIGVLPINQPVGFVVKDDTHTLELKDELAEWLITDEPVELKFDDEPGRTYYAVVQNTMDDFDKFVDQRSGTIQFLCLDPYAYGPEISTGFTSDTAIIPNNGSAPADPIIELEVEQPTTFAMVQNQKQEYQLIGIPTDVDEEVVDKKTVIFDEVGDTLNTWTTPSGFEGEFVKGSRGIQVQSYGTGSSWHGPGLMKEVTPVKDFELEFFVNVRTERTDMPFRITTNLYDEGMNEIGMLRLWDKSPSRIQKNAEARIGHYVDQYENYLVSDKNYNIKEQRVWSGILRLVREGNKLSVYIARISQAGNHIKTIKRSFTDNSNQFAGLLKFVRINVAKYGEYDKANEAGINRIRLNELNQIAVDQTPYIAYPGDIITFDHVNEEILINGEDRKDLKDFGGSFFQLAKVENQLIMHPANSFFGNVKYRTRYR